MQNRTPRKAAAIAMSSSEITTTKRQKYHQQVFTVLYRQYATRVYRYIFARVNTHADAEDLTAQVFLEALKGVERLDGSGNFPAWLFTVARNKVVDSYRRKKPVQSGEGVLETIAGEGDPLNRISQDETIMELIQLVQGLEPDQQELLQLRFAGELTYAQIAEVAGKSEAAVKMSIHRLLDRLQDEMEQSNE